MHGAARQPGPFAVGQSEGDARRLTRAGKACVTECVGRWFASLGVWFQRVAHAQE